MNAKPIIVIPPTHEQTTPSFHIEGGLAAAFLEFLKTKGITAWQPPEKLETKGEDHRSIVEVEIEAGTPLSKLEALAEAFLSEHDSPAKS
jgi:hypothetical protein